MHVSITNLQFFALDAGTYDFTIATGDNGGAVLWQDSIDCVVGWNNIKREFITPVNQIYKTISATVLADTYRTIKSTIGSTSVGGGGCGCASSCCSDCCTAQVKGFQYNSDTAETIVSDDNIHGLRAHVSLKCDYEGLICANSDLFATALWYLLGRELMVERLFTDRINKWSTIDRPKAQQLHDIFANTYEKELNLVIDGIDLNDSGCCIECDPQIRLVEVHP
jgi:hypothetical protein